MRQGAGEQVWRVRVKAQMHVITTVVKAPCYDVSSDVQMC